MFYERCQNFHDFLKKENKIKTQKEKRRWLQGCILIISRLLFAVVYIFLTAGIFGGTAELLSAEEEPSSCTYPRRIVCLETYPAEILCDLGEIDRIVAISKFQKHNSYYTFLKNKPVVGGGVGSNINLEMILGVNPDLIFCGDGQADILKDRGLKVYGTRTYDIEGIMELITDIGKIAGKEKEAKKIVDKMKARIQRIEVKVKEVKKRPLVYFEQSSLGKTRSKGSLTHELITRAGGINIAKDEPVPFPILSQEFIIKKNPDIIIVEEWGTKPSIQC